MANVVVIGMQWGDEGKGKIVDLICPAFDGVVRYQGGHNAGHTVKFGDRHFSLHLIPSGVVHAGMQCVLGNGMVIAPDALFTELDRLAAADVDHSGRLRISDRAIVLLPVHAALDQAREASLGDDKIGTTSRGIGPAYESRASRSALRIGGLLADDLEDRLAVLLDQLRPQLAALGAPPAPDAAELAGLCRGWGERMAPLVADVSRLLTGWIDDGKSLLFEGAQGTLLDVDHGTFPYVTSSNTTAGAAATGTGVPPTALDGVLGILKAYTTRVGEGPFVTELTDEDGPGAGLRERGNEFGTTTGRPRRCGWLDTVVASYARRINGIDAIALTKLDILDQLDEIPVCVAYRIDGREVTELPADLSALERAEPVYEILPGWRSTTTGLLEVDQLPAAAQGYVRFIEERVGAPVAFISTGPRREETIARRDSPALERLLGDRLAAVLAGRGA